MTISKKVPHMIFVHRYKWSHERKRKKYKKLLKEEKISLLRTVKDGWVYIIS